MWGTKTNTLIHIKICWGDIYRSTLRWCTYAHIHSSSPNTISSEKKSKTFVKYYFNPKKSNVKPLSITTSFHSTTKSSWEGFLVDGSHDHPFLLSVSILSPRPENKPWRNIFPWVGNFVFFRNRDISKGRPCWVPIGEDVLSSHQLICRFLSTYKKSNYLIIRNTIQFSSVTTRNYPWRISPHPTDDTGPSVHESDIVRWQDFLQMERGEGQTMTC